MYICDPISNRYCLVISWEDRSHEKLGEIEDENEKKVFVHHAKTQKKRNAWKDARADFLGGKKKHRMPWEEAEEVKDDPFKNHRFLNFYFSDLEKGR